MRPLIFRKRLLEFYIYDAELIISCNIYVYAFRLLVDLGFSFLYVMAGTRGWLSGTTLNRVEVGGASFFYGWISPVITVGTYCLFIYLSLQQYIFFFSCSSRSVRIIRNIHLLLYIWCPGWHPLESDSESLV